MAKRKQSRKESVPPTMPPHQAVLLIRRQIERLDDIMKLPYNHPEVDAWESTTANILNAVYGLPNGELHPNTSEVNYAQSGEPLSMNMSAAELQRDHGLKQLKRKALLEAYLEQLQVLAPPGAAAAPDEYRVHPEIEKVSGQLYRDGHYKSAALEAYIRVIAEVRGRSGLDEDGDRLMNRAFGCENQTPVIQFNSLQTTEERDEQKGLMFLYKGIVGLRNSKAHSNRLFNDPQRAHEYLAVASLLMRLLEIGQSNRPS